MQQISYAMEDSDPFPFETGEWVMFYNMAPEDLHVQIMVGKILDVEEYYIKVLTRLNGESGIMSLDKDAVFDWTPERMSYFLEDEFKDVLINLRRGQLKVLTND